MPVPTSTRQHLEDHLGQAEFDLNVASNFECLAGTPAHHAVRAALAQVAEARTWVRENLAPTQAIALPIEAFSLSPAERHRLILRRMARLRP